ncbi:MAG: 8-oxoguanine glycosylase domain protein [Verrucomicrobiales bacterium]|nr:8-oxoguanine glycosylase domain protein [Verrucomicrobiales bacterium]
MAANEKIFAVDRYDLAATLSSGQAFRWRQRGKNWESVIAGRWVGLQQTDEGIHARTAVAQTDWDWLRHYLQTEIDFPAVLETFPGDAHLTRAKLQCSGLRLLRQEPWECLASFILSSTKQIVQIQQIVAVLCQRFGDSVVVPAGTEPWFAFPSASRLAGCTESELRECKMGFRAPYLLAAAQMVAGGELDLNALEGRTVTEARAELIKVHGVGRKIADCVLLFAYGFQAAFPVDVWVMKALRELYFPKRRVKQPRLIAFSETYFGANAGYAQQYLFHYMRTQHPKAKSPSRKAR